MEVCPRERFIGRRRQIQTCLRVLRARQDDANYHDGVLLYGMGGLGKSSLAARLCDRMTGFERVVCVGPLDEPALLRAIGNQITDPQVAAIMNEPNLPLQNRLRRVLAGPLAAAPKLFIFDDFEQNTEGYEKTPREVRLDDQGRAILKPAPIAILRDLLEAVRQEASNSRVIVTCRYDFPPVSRMAHLFEQPLDSLRDADLDKKLEQLPGFAKAGLIDEESRRRALALAAGNPRLLERLNLILEDQLTDHNAILAAMEQTAEDFREDVLLKTLLDQQTTECRRLLAQWSVCNLPVDEKALIAIADGAPIQPHLSRAIALGLVEVSPDPASGLDHYLVSNVLAPLLAPLLTEPERIEACRRAAQHLFEIWWVKVENRRFDRALAIHQLAMLAADHTIAVEIADRVATVWIGLSRYREAGVLSRVTLALGEDYRLRHNLARVEAVLGDSTTALEDYRRALAACPPVAGETPAPDVAERAAIMHNLAGLLAQQGDVTKAMKLWEESLELKQQIGDLQGQAATLHRMAGVIAQQGDVVKAMKLHEESLKLKQQNGDLRGQAATRHAMAGLIARQGDVTKAMKLWEESLELTQQTGDLRGQAATLHQMAGVIAQQGDVVKAVKLYEESLKLKQQIGDLCAQAATLANMAWAAGLSGDSLRERELNLASARLLASARAWVDLVTVLTNLGTDDRAESTVFLCQAAWLTSRATVPIDDVLRLAAALNMRLTASADASPLVAAFALHSVARANENHPKRKEYMKYTNAMLAACCEARNIPPEQAQEWFHSQGLGDLETLLPKLRQALEALVPDDAWLFDRSLFDADAGP